MNELQKCLTGEYYDCHDDIFLSYKNTARKLLSQYNTLPYDAKEKKRNILEKLFGSIGRNVSVGSPFICDYGRHIHIGSNVSINMNCTFVDCNKITIGNNVLIASNVQFYTSAHPVELADRLTDGWTPDSSAYFCNTYALPITVGNGCWIGGGVILLPGVTIGPGSVIGAGSVVTKDIPANCVAAGNPCRVIREINKPAIRIVAFDLDGTICDSLPLCLKAFREAASAYTGYALSVEEIIETFGVNETGMMKAIVKDRWEPALEDFYTLYQKYHDMCSAAFPGILELIDYLKIKQIHVALITGKGSRSCDITLAKLGMQNTFCEILTGSEKAPNKAAAMLELMKKYAVSKDEFYYIGDTVTDIESCRAAGVTCLSAGWQDPETAEYLHQENPDHTFSTVKELHKFLKSYLA